jgi:hypothetical protein
MPRSRRKTEADRPTYRPPSNSPSYLTPFLAGRLLRRIVEQCGMNNVRAVLGAMGGPPRELIERRCSETLDGWKSGMRPMVAATVEAPAPLMPSDERRSIPGYRRHREAAIDSIISKQARDRELEDGLAVILERKERVPGYRRQVVEIVDGIEAGQTVAQIALGLGVHPRTVERRLVDIRKAAAVSAEAEQLSGPCPPAGQNDGLGPEPPLYL